MATIMYIVTFLSLCVIASGLDCYECNDCSSFFSYSSRSEKCSEPFSLGAITEPQCFKQIDSDGTVNRGCSTESLCFARQTVNRCSDNEVGCYTCCDGPNCNSASFLTVSMATLVMSAALAIVRML